MKSFFLIISMLISFSVNADENIFSNKTLSNFYMNPKNDAPIIIADTKRINNIGWKPIYDIERGLDDTISWFKRN